MGEDLELEVALSAEALQVVERPRVVAVECRPCTDAEGRAALEVHLVLDLGHEDPEALVSGARSIWEAVLERLTGGGETRFPYVRFHCHGEAEGGALRR